MTDNEINAAIAEACGWTQISSDGVTGKVPNETCNRVMFVPLYCTDLNAMHLAEKVLDKLTEWNGEKHHWHASETYIAILSQIVRRHTGFKTWDDFELATTTARQRAEAFLRTLGKWKEVQA